MYNILDFNHDAYSTIAPLNVTHNLTTTIVKTSVKTNANADLFINILTYIDYVNRCISFSFFLAYFAALVRGIQTDEIIQYDIRASRESSGLCLCVHVHVLLHEHDAHHPRSDHIQRRVHHLRVGMGCAQVFARIRHPTPSRISTDGRVLCERVQIHQQNLLAH